MGTYFKFTAVETRDEALPYTGVTQANDGRGNLEPHEPFVESYCETSSDKTYWIAPNQGSLNTRIAKFLGQVMVPWRRTIDLNRGQSGKEAKIARSWFSYGQTDSRGSGEK